MAYIVVGVAERIPQIKNRNDKLNRKENETMVYEKRTVNGKFQMLVASDSANEVITNCTRQMTKANCFYNIFKKAYRGSKYANCVWVVIG